MLLRNSFEEYEQQYLSPYATLSKYSKGRKVQEEECDIRTVFQRDRDRILHCKAFRRLKDKTQVFLTPDGDHYRTRLTHTLEVSQNARTIAKALRLNEDLVEAIALGHDLGHTPFGHAGERALNMACREGFRHNLQSVRTVDFLEKSGVGLNLTMEVRDGIRNHQTSEMPSTLEGKIVRLSDKIAYIYHDMDDAIRGGIIVEEDVPLAIRNLLGETSKDRLDYLIHDLITNSIGHNEIAMSKETEEGFRELRKFMFAKVYRNPEAKSEEMKAEHLIYALYEYYCDHAHILPREHHERMEKYGDSKERVVCDYVGAMTDRFAISTYKELTIPKSWHG
ncbi:MAG: deoxyguanosinetriphosphate triphosphohydrolase [Eubacteriales bacterium]